LIYSAIFLRIFYLKIKNYLLFIGDNIFVMWSDGEFQMLIACLLLNSLLIIDRLKIILIVYF